VSTWNCEQQAADVRLPKCADRDAWLKLWADHHANGAQGESSPPPKSRIPPGSIFSIPPCPCTLCLPSARVE
jgi:hypothetical protein